MDASDNETLPSARHGQNDPAMALNRKNALFAGSDDGGDNWAVIATLIECCKLNGVNPHDWLTGSLTSLAQGHPANNIAQLMPWVSFLDEN